MLQDGLAFVDKAVYQCLCKAESGLFSGKQLPRGECRVRSHHDHRVRVQ